MSPRAIASISPDRSTPITWVTHRLDFFVACMVHVTLPEGQRFGARKQNQRSAVLQAQRTFLVPNLPGA